MEEEYLGVVLEPHRMEKEFPDYPDEAMHYMMELDHRCIVSEEPEKYFRGAFQVLDYDIFPEYVRRIDPDRVFLSGQPEKFSETVEILRDRDVVLDRNILDRSSIETPDTIRILKEEAKALIPMYSPEREKAEAKTADELLEELGLEDLDTLPVQSLR